MARGSYLTGTLKAGILGAALVAGLAAPASAGDPPKLALTGSATMTTDYMFRSISNSGQLPAVQPEFDLTYGILYGYIWGSNVSDAIGEGIEIDYGAGITPKWAGIDFNFAALYYTYPGANSELDYLEVRTSAAHAFDKLTLSIGNWWSPNYAKTGLQSDAIEFGASYAFAGKLWNFFTPSISAAVGVQMYEDPIPDYTYWNAGVTLGFLDHWSADIRYYDTDYSQPDCFNLIGDRNSCDARAVGTIKATF
jgi:uncharacterized protein (TIGR02001 family)